MKKAGPFWSIWVRQPHWRSHSRCVERQLTDNVVVCLRWRGPLQLSAPKLTKLRDSALHFCSALGECLGPGSHFPKLLDSRSEAVEFLGYSLAAMSHLLHSQISHLSIPKHRIAYRCVFKSQLANRNSFRRKIAEKSRNEIVNPCVSKSQIPNRSVFAFRQARTGRTCPNFQNYKIATISCGCDVESQRI